MLDKDSQIEVINNYTDKGFISVFQRNAIIHDIIRNEQSDVSVHDNTAAGEAFVINPKEISGNRKLSGANLRKYVTVVSYVFAAGLIGSAIIYFVAANWGLFGTSVKLAFVGILIVFGCAIGALAYSKDSALLRECSGVVCLSIAIGAFALVSQIYHIQGDLSVFLTAILPIAIALTLGFESRLLYAITSLIMIGASALNDYRYWWLVFAWIGYDILRSAFSPLRNNDADHRVMETPSIVVQLVVLTYGILFSFRDTTVSLCVFITTLFTYDRIYSLMSAKYGRNIFKMAALILYAISVGPVYYSWQDKKAFIDQEPYYLLVVLAIVSMYIFTCKQQSKGFASPRNGFRLLGVYFPMSSVIMFSSFIGASISYLSTVVGLIAFILPVTTAYIWAGEKHAHNKYSMFGVSTMVYLVSLVVLFTKGNYINRAIMAAVTGSALLILNWGIKKYVAQEHVE